MGPYLWMLWGALAFALMGALAHALAPLCPWQVVAVARALLALVFALSLARLTKTPLVFWRPGILWLRSLAGSVSMLGTFYALTHLPPPDALTLTNMFPLWLTLLEAVVRRRFPPLSTWLAVGCGLLGVVLIQRPHLGAESFAAIVALASSFSTALAMFGLHHLKQVSGRAVVVHFSAVSSVVCLASLLVFPQAGPAISEPGRAALLLLGVGLSATAGQLLLTKAFAAGIPSRVSVVALAQVPFAVLLDALWWGRLIGPGTLAGMGLVLVPTALLLLRGGDPPEVAAP